MKIEDLNIEVRPRTGWQALDLGITLAKHWYLPLLICFAIPVCLVSLACLLLLTNRPELAIVCVWWFKPLYERIPLSFLSTAIFGDAPSVKGAWKRWRSSVLPGLFSSLTYLRLSPTRSFKTPILILEGLSGVEQKKRIGVLNASQGNEATWLTILCVHVEAFINLGMVVFLAMFLPEELLSKVWEAYFEGLNVYQGWLNNLFYLAAIILIGPFYVASGFALYLNRRVELEAWDIELGFRRIARRLSSAPAVLIVLCFAVSEAAPHANAAVPDTYEVPVVTPTDRDASKQAITEILATEPYHQIQTFSYPEFLKNIDWDAKSGEARDQTWDLSWLAVLAEICLWIMAIGAALWLALRLKLLERLRFGPEVSAPAPPGKLFGVALNSQAMPDDILQAAVENWQSGDQRAALSLLLRGWLLQMIKNYGCRFQEGDTERECLLVVKRQTEAETHQRFGRLVSTWQRVAYGHQPAGSEVFERLLSDWTMQWVTPVE